MTKELLRQALEARIAELMPLFIEARDALPAISMVSAKFHNLDLTLGARMDSVGTKDWRAAIAQPVPIAEGDAKDTERYRLLRGALTDSDSTLFVGVDWPDYQGRWALGGDEADKAIDEAVAAIKKGLL